MKSIYVDSLTQDYVNQNGMLANDNSLRTEAYIRVATPRANWLYSPSAFYGSDLYLYSNKRQQLTKNTLIQALQRCLNPMLQNQEAQSITVNIKYAYPTQYAFDVTIIDVNGEVITFTQKAVI